MPKYLIACVACLLTASFLLLPLTQAAASSDTLKILLPGASPYLLGQEQWEVLGFSSMGRQKLATETDTIRLNTTNHFLLLMLGLSPDRRFNVGFEIQAGQISQQAQNGETGISPLQYQGLSALGLRVRAEPLASLPELTLQGALLLPAAGDRTARQALGRDRLQALLQVNIYQQFMPWLYVFLQADASVFFRSRERQQTSYAFPLSLYAVAEVMPEQLYVFPSLSYSSEYLPEYKGFLRSNGSQVLGGLGLQYVVSPHFSLNIQAQLPLSYRLPSQTYDYVSGSFSRLNIGIRCVN